MHKILLTALLFACLGNTIHAQTDSLIIPVAKNQTLIEQFLGTPGYLIKKEVVPAGNLRGYIFDVIKVSNLENFQSVSGIRITQDFSAGLISKQPLSIKTFLDSREVDGMLTTLQYMRTIVKMQSFPENYTEVLFNGLGGSQLVLYLSQPAQSIKRWGLAFQINTDIPKTFTNLYINDIDTLIALLEAAKKKF